MVNAEQQFVALADPSRRAIFEKLAKQPLAVGQLAMHFPISRPAVSQHLRVLGEAKLVRHVRAGAQNIYSVNPEGIATLRGYLDSIWSRALADFKSVAEASYRKPAKEKP